MRKSMLVILAAMVVLAATPAVAELQNVIVGGDIRIRGNYYDGAGVGGPGIVWNNAVIPGRAIGNLQAPGGINDVVGFTGWDDDDNSLGFVEFRTRVNVKADFSNEVSAFIELDSYDNWGDDFRSDYITGLDNAGTGADDVALYQAYIEASEMWGLPLSVRVGRQELAFGSQWLVGVNDASSFFTGLSFDAIRATYATDMFTVDAFAAELLEGYTAEEDEDIWFYGVYGSYLGLEDIVIDAYWMWLRDARDIDDTPLNNTWLNNWLEDLFGVNDYGTTNLHTIGLRGAGTIGAIDFEAELAYQFGDAGQVGQNFRTAIYGDDDADFDAWAGNLEVGYTFDMTWQPRVWIGGAYFEGEDNRDVNFWDWIGRGWRLERDASVSFNRLFSNWEYSEILDATDLSNFWTIRGGVDVMPTESIELSLTATYLETVDEFEAPYHFTIFNTNIVPFPLFSWITDTNDSNLGLELGLYGTYHYSEDLAINAGWAHLFTDDGASEGQYVIMNGLGFTGSDTNDDDDVDYLFIETEISF